MTEAFETEAELEEARLGWQCNDDSAALWAIKRIREAQEDTKRWEAHYAAQLDKVKNENQNTVNYFKTKLAEYFETVPHRETSTQAKYSLPGCDLVLKRGGIEYIRDESALLPWVKANRGDCVKVKVEESVAWAELKKSIEVVNGMAVIKGTGEIVSGVTTARKPDTFEVVIK